MRQVDVNALIRLKACSHRLTHQQYKTLRGQILSGNTEGAMRGLRKILQRGQEGDSH